jgi:N-acetylmuramic acid 6-phosphate etherase
VSFERCNFRCTPNPSANRGVHYRYNFKMPSRTRPRQRNEQRPTEQRNPASRNLDRMSVAKMLRMINREDRRVAGRVGREIPAIAKAVEAIVPRMQRGGRLIYVGAGTSGRLAVLDAAECPPTFGISRSLVRAMLAGGRKALTRAVEGAEDSPKNAVRDLRKATLTQRDVVVGVAASGSTPYVMAAVKFARRQGALTIGLASNRDCPLRNAVDIAITPEVGPEVVAGSTRLKAGTSEKLVLNMLSTAVMVRLGHVYDNLMIDMALTNQKLKERSTRILIEASGKNAKTVQHTLRQSGHNLRVALLMLKLGVTASAARKKLAESKGNLRAALGE